MVEADVLRDGHARLAVLARYRGPGEEVFRETAMRPIDGEGDGVRWRGEFEVDRPGRWEWTVEACLDAFGTWQDELVRSVASAPEALASVMSDGLAILRDAAATTASSSDRELIDSALRILESEIASESASRNEVAPFGPDLWDAVRRAQPRLERASLSSSLWVEVDRPRARFGSWYDLLPRSWGGLTGVTRNVERFAALGFDVICLGPIHPIGHTNRRGRDNAPVTTADDPGSPWAIGNETGGHDAIHPDLGTIADLQALTRHATDSGIDVALDLAFQCSPDHPWVTAHPGWFRSRADGTLVYLEDPPNRHEDAYEIDWGSPDWREIWDALLTVVLGWVDCGVKVFRVDNPHTQPFAFWAWLIDNAHIRDRDVVFVAKSVTRPAVMRLLAKIGFSQSHTHFMAMTSRAQLTEYIEELADSELQQYLRPVLYPATLDALPEYLQQAGTSAFEARLVLAATLGPSYGIYSGYEHEESVPLREGSEEYLHSEKYELKERALDGPLLPLVKRLNEARRANPALQELSNIIFLDTRNEALIAYAKQSQDNTVLTVVNLDPEEPQDGLPSVPESLGLPSQFIVHDLLSGEHYKWQLGRNYVRLEPGVRQALVLRVEPRRATGGPLD